MKTMRIKYSEASKILTAKDNFLIITHRNPDGDAIGSAAALCSALQRNGKKAYLYPNPQITPKYMRFAEKFLAPESFSPDYVIAVDTASESQFPNGFGGNVDCCFDHHPSNTAYAQNLLLEAERAACGEIIRKLIRMTWGSVTKEEATLLYMALSTDTGCFLYSNTDEHAFKTAADLVKDGADTELVNNTFFRKISPARMKLEGLIYNGMEFYRERQIAVAVVTQKMLEECGTDEDDLDDLAAIAGRAMGAKLSITIKETDKGTCRISLRSDDDVNSSDICAVFGGGGHKKAAGCSIDSSPERAKEMLLDVVNEIWH